MARVSYTYEDDEKGWRLECVVAATVVPYERADRGGPAEGGYLEDVEFEVAFFHLTVGNQEYDMEKALTPVLRDALASEVKRAYDNSPRMQDAVWSEFEGR